MQFKIYINLNGKPYGFEWRKIEDLISNYENRIDLIKEQENIFMFELIRRVKESIIFDRSFKRIEKTRLKY